MTIIYIDDDADDRDIFSEAVSLVDSSNTCITLSTGYELPRLLAETNASLLVLDINMPAPDGREILRRVRADERFTYLYICMFSTWMSNEDAEHYLKMGANACMRKPTRFYELYNFLKKLLQSNLTETCQTKTIHLP